MRFLTLAATGAALMLSACGGGGDDGHVTSTPYPPGGGGAMDGSTWSFGPAIDGKNYSVGVPTHPVNIDDGWAFDIPQPFSSSGHVHYVTKSTGSLAGKSRVVLKYRIEAEPDVQFNPTKYPGYQPQLTLYFQRAGDDWSGTGKYETYRWWATFATKVVKAGEGEIVAPLDANWTAVQSSSANSAPGAFRDAKENAGKIGFTFGGGDGYGHGVYATGPARFVVTDFHVE